MKGRLTAVIFSILLPMTLQAEAPVVDQSENYAMLDEQQISVEEPAAQAQMGEVEDVNAADEQAFAVDDQQQKPLASAKDNAELLEKMQRMQQEIQELRGQLEVQAHELNVLKEQQVSF